MNLTPRKLLLAGAGAVVAVVVLASWADTDGPAPGSRSRPAAPATDLATAPTAPTSSTSTGSPAPAGTTAEPVQTGPRDDGVVPNTDTPAVEDKTRVRDAAAGFGRAWLNTYPQTEQQWREALLPLVTADQAELFADAGYDKVPAGLVGDKVAVEPLGDGGLWTADVPVLVDRGGKLRGTLHLTLIEQDGTWLISEIDYSEAGR